MITNDNKRYQRRVKLNTYVISIDIGTQGTKAALFDGNMKLIADAFRESRLISPRPGTVWQEPDDLYISCAETIKELLDKSASIQRM